MARIRADRPTSEAYQALRVASNVVGEGNRRDCSVKAVAIITGESYERVLEVMRREGRRDGRGTPQCITLDTLAELGWTVRLWLDSEMQRVLPFRKRGRGNITSYHPIRFPEWWAPVAARGARLLMRSRGHMWAYTNGRVHDWSETRAVRVTNIWEVTKREVV